MEIEIIYGNFPVIEIEPIVLVKEWLSMKNTKINEALMREHIMNLENRRYRKRRISN